MSDREVNSAETKLQSASVDRSPALAKGRRIPGAGLLQIHSEISSKDKNR